MKLFTYVRFVVPLLTSCVVNEYCYEYIQEEEAEKSATIKLVMWKHNIITTLVVHLISLGVHIARDSINILIMPHKDLEKRREYRKNYYKKYYSKNKKALYLQNKQRRLEIRQLIVDIKSKLKCKECGENHIACLDFHHRDNENKICDISSLATKGSSKTFIETEISKCDILCANCHRKLHWEDKGRISLAEE